MGTLILDRAAENAAAECRPRASIIVVVPAYNEERNIARVIQDLRNSAPEYDRLVVNDGATDNTGRILAELGERQLRLPCNLGYGRAIQAGLRYALEHGYDLVVTFDADGQHRASDLPRLVQAMSDAQADLAIGSRYVGGHPYDGPWGRRLGQRVFSYLTALLVGRRVYDTTSGLKAMSAATCRELVRAVSHDFHIETIVALSIRGFRIVEEPITMDRRRNGHSMHSLISAISYPLQTLLVTVVALIDGRIVRRLK